MLTCPECGSDDLDLLGRLEDGRKEVHCEDCGHAWLQGDALPDPQLGKILRVFSDDDRGYMDWILTWPRGYVLNCEARPRSAYLILHRGSCKSITELGPDMKTFTGDYIKICSTDRNAVKEWARETTGSTPTMCQLCM